MNLEVMKIMNLKDYCFYVPAYQRGYRWTEFEVKALLDDIYEFSTDGDKSYCIQPLIVQKDQNGSYAVVDGQQRLTTIYIFMKIAEQEIRSAKPLFELKYQTRDESEKFLKELSDDTDFETEAKKNIDFYHIVKAYQTINQWLLEKDDKSVAIQELNTKIRKNVFFIWYEISQEVDAVDQFRKVNMGKIPLTDAELIKALIMNKENYLTDSEKRQTEISLSWDRIEQGLQEDSFWYFLNEKGKYKTRIDLIFHLLAKQRNKTLEHPIPEKQNNFSFLVFLTEMNRLAIPEKEKYIEELWGQVESIYSDFQNWYSDIEKYHIIGYLVCAGVSIQEIYQLSQNKKKSEVLSLLVEQTKIVTKLKQDLKEEICSLSYDSYNHRKKMKNILLLFNIASLICNSEKQYRFPFYLYKETEKNKVSWDLEHIHATADDTAEADDTIGNVTLLDSRTNRSYQDETFHEKRKVILCNEKNGRFIPLCTKNIFLKAYTDNPSNMTLWDQTDKEAYVNEIVNVLNKFYEREWMSNE